jgi:hypothetical protein
LFKSLNEKVQADPRVFALIVFGSYARRELYRDIDICLVLFPEEDSFQVLLDYATESSENFDVKVFSTLPLYIRSRVLKEGKILVNKDYDTLFDIYLQSIKENVLFEPHFRTFLEAVKYG